MSLKLGDTAHDANTKAFVTFPSFYTLMF